MSLNMKKKLCQSLWKHKNEIWGIYLHKNETYPHCCSSHRKLEKTAPGLKKLFRRPFSHSQVSQPNSQSIYIQCSVLSSNNSLSLSGSLVHTRTCSLHGLGHDDTYQHYRDNPYARWMPVSQVHRVETWQREEKGWEVTRRDQDSLGSQISKQEGISCIYPGSFGLSAVDALKKKKKKTPNSHGN